MAGLDISSMHNIAHKQTGVHTSTHTRGAHSFLLALIHSSTQASRRQQQEQEQLIKEYELRQKIKSVVVPTDDGRVKQMLRQLGDPITLFGEKEVRTCVGISTLTAYCSR
jgi:U4/U6 small nuclear ribonucleoprotein PRP4